MPELRARILWETRPKTKSFVSSVARVGETGFDNSELPSLEGEKKKRNVVWKRLARRPTKDSEIHISPFPFKKKFDRAYTLSAVKAVRQRNFTTIHKKNVDRKRLTRILNPVYFGEKRG